ncbi:uncharacterized protein LOC111252719 isoform X2 [Varroa destructor]|uniref:PWWP domain-containing protein n=1 Tax=Varroa destructor TaxID=109461 RepID=A0A7M7KJE4_VARDE|nr:uncharacterized protein LOC111252719 isoform X2 [Varroa destructor]
MECPRDTKSVVGEVHLMEEDNDENEILVDANGLDIPPGEISVYKDPSGELVLVVHTDDAESSSKKASDQVTSSSFGVAEAVRGHTDLTTVDAPENSQSESSQHCVTAVEGLRSPSSQHNEHDEVEALDQRQADRTKAVPIVDEPMEIDNDTQFPVETMDSDSAMATQDTSLSTESPTENVHPGSGEEMGEVLQHEEVQESLQSKAVEKSGGQNDTVNVVLSNSEETMAEGPCKFAETPKSSEISRSSKAADTPGPIIKVDISLSSKEVEEYSSDGDTNTALPAADGGSPTLTSEDGHSSLKREEASENEVVTKPSTGIEVTVKSTTSDTDKAAGETTEDDYLGQSSQPVQRFDDDDKATAELPGGSFAPLLISGKPDENLLINNNNNRENKGHPESKAMEITPSSEDAMGVDEESANAASSGDAELLAETSPILMPVSHTVDIEESRKEIPFAPLDQSSKQRVLSGVASDRGEQKTDEIEEPPKKKRGRPPKKQHQRGEGDRKGLLDGSAISALAQSQPGNTFHIRKANTDNGDSKEAPRRSGRERQVKRYEDYIEDNWDDDGEDGEEGDGLTARERKELDKKLRKQRSLSGRLGHGTSRNAASWVKKCNIIIGETATRDGSKFKTKKAEPVQQIEQAPPRPSQAVIRYYLPKKMVEPEPPVTHCRIMYRPQDTFGVDMAQKRKRGMQDDYTCRCQYWTSRINNYIRHLRDHCPFSKDFFSWDEGMLKEVTKGQKQGVSKKMDVKTVPATLIGGVAVSEGRNDVSGQYTHSNAKEIKDSAKGNALAKPPIEPRDGGSTVAPVSRGKYRRGGACAGDDRPTPGDEVGDATVSARLGFRKHDIVWADLGKGVHWPALVLSIRNRGLQGKARVNTMQVKVYLVHDGETRTLPISKVDGFDSARRHNYLEIGRGGRGALAVDHARAAQKADKFLRERVLGTNIDPIRFFCLGETKLIEDQESSTSSSDEDEGVTEEIGGDGAGTPPKWALPEIELDPVTAGDQQKNNGGSSNSGNDIVQALHIVKKAKRRRKLNNNALVEFIVNGKVEPHLVGIYRGTVPSERHASFMSADEARRSALKKSTSWGPVDDVGQQEAVFEYCEDLIQRSAGDSEGTPGSESGSEQLDKHTYAFEVFCPEAITKAISRLARVGMETAAQLFLKGHEQSKQFSEIQDIATKEQELERAAQKSKEEAIERERQAKTTTATDIIASTGNQQSVSEDIAQDRGEAEVGEKKSVEGEGRSEQLNTGDVVREELERLGVDQKLLEVLDKDDA